MRLAIGLRYLAGGTSFPMLSLAFCVSHSSVVVAVRRVVHAIAALSPDYIKIPRNQQEWKAIAARFEARYEIYVVILIHLTVYNDKKKKMNNICNGNFHLKYY